MQQVDGGQFDMAGAPLAGTPEQLAEDVDRLIAMDVHEIFLDLTTGGFTLKEQLDMLPVLASLQVG
jgi:hypothetical protein